MRGSTGGQSTEFVDRHGDLDDAAPMGVPPWPL
jgi:hypothetical protein